MRLNYRINNGILLFLLLFNTAKAETLVLIHGYLSSSERWAEKSAIQPLYRAGWQYGGNYNGSAQGLVAPKIKDLSVKGKVFVTVDLPDEAPIGYQVRVLDRYLQHLYLQRKEPIILVGHSAGGVVARTWLTYPSAKPVSTLITIASPHRGTPLARAASLGASTPLSGAVRMMGIKSVSRSKGLFKDLTPPKLGNFLYWLNHQSYPQIHYVSIIRKNKLGFRDFDALVPRESQNMNNIYSLRGRSAVLWSNGSHSISREDGDNIVWVLEKLKGK
ncbi:MAG: alpha/beta fold hydrolase [Thiotrichaceae bacterium]|nr:alpha/beta fold hydrolase [Thiotrichaceae bacterium]